MTNSTGKNLFGVNTLIWTEEFTEKDLWIIPRACEIGCEVIDINISNIDSFPKKKIRSSLTEYGIVPVVTTALKVKDNPVSEDRAVRENALTVLKKLIDIANEIGAKIVAGVIYAAWGYKTGAPRTEDEWKRSIEVMQKAAEYAQETGKVTLNVEAINRYVTHFLNVAEDGVKYCREVGFDNVKVHLDSFHMAIEERSYEEAIRTCGRDYLGYFHTCESHRGIPGTGMVPWNDVFRVLKQVRYEGPLVIESYDPKFRTVASNSCCWRTLASSGEELARQGLRYLKETYANAK